MDKAGRKSFLGPAAPLLILRIWIDANFAIEINLTGDEQSLPFPQANREVKRREGKSRTDTVMLSRDRVVAAKYEDPSLFQSYGTIRIMILRY